ncbi:Dolichol phosphate-mannose biosynthesis regulatory protein [Lamellibrachia satsuma]|nr:Dolichol phosphate-mannose biosynthesis regulatory protein [Lamellibrachia satsuma]
MATGSDQAVGYGLMATAGLIFTYYTLWIVIMPFVDEDYIIHQYFPSRVYALAIPIAAGVIALLGLGKLIVSSVLGS